MGNDFPPDFSPHLFLKNEYIDDSPWPKIYDFRIALIQMNLQDSDFDKKKVDGHTLLEIIPEKKDRIKEIILETSKEAINNLGAKIVVFSEL